MIRFINIIILVWLRYDEASVICCCSCQRRDGSTVATICARWTSRAQTTIVQTIGNVGFGDIIRVFGLEQKIIVVDFFVDGDQELFVFNNVLDKIVRVQNTTVSQCLQVKNVHHTVLWLITWNLNRCELKRLNLNFFFLV